MNRQRNHRLSILFVSLVFVGMACNQVDRKKTIPETPVLHQHEAHHQVSSQTIFDSTAPQSNTATQHVGDLPIPVTMEFAGEAVPLTEDDTRESLEYELYSNCYRHSRTSIVIKRAYRWKPMIDSILDYNGIPKDFFYLAIAESELSNAARSGVGATGMWQFMKGTGKEYGLTINRDIDERRHPVKATQAACEYLKKAYERFSNWTLVAASYNMGQSGVSRKLKDQKCDSYYDLHLYTETSRYVFRILAFKLILEHPEEYGFFIPESARYQPLDVKEEVVTKTIDDLPQFAKNHGTTYKDLRRLNPWFNNTSSYKLSVAKKDSVILWLPR